MPVIGAQTSSRREATAFSQESEKTPLPSKASIKLTEVPGCLSHCRLDVTRFFADLPGAPLWLALLRRRRRPEQAHGPETQPGGCDRRENEPGVRRHPPSFGEETRHMRHDQKTKDRAARYQVGSHGDCSGKASSTNPASPAAAANQAHANLRGVRRSPIMPAFYLAYGDSALQRVIPEVLPLFCPPLCPSPCG